MVSRTGTRLLRGWFCVCICLQIYFMESALARHGSSMRRPRTLLHKAFEDPELRRARMAALSSSTRALA